MEDVSAVKVDRPKISPPSSQKDNVIGSLLKERKVPVKVDPKVYFSNERIFLAWISSAL